MTPKEFVQIQDALGYDNDALADQLDMSLRMVVYMRAGQKAITDRTAEKMKRLIVAKINALTLLQRCFK
jgi:plasmid maintenance system antidote protein VapI